MSDQSQRFTLSVLLVTYNHEKYIAKAMASLFNQVFDGSIELIVADDASTDNTLNIIREFEHKDPRFSFKYLDNRINLGITKNYQRAFAACSGEFIAVLEGDDVWIRNYKLQQQIDFLLSHFECDLCAVNYLSFDQKTTEMTPRQPVGQGFRYIDAASLIKDNIIGNFSTCMYRASAIHALAPEIFETCTYDWLINILVSQRGAICFLNEPMSLYRLHNAGTWSQNNQIEQFRLQLDLLPVYDRLSQGHFHNEFHKLAKHLRCSIKFLEFSALPIVKRVTQLKKIPFFRPFMTVLSKIKTFLIRAFA